jgi:hypothetical protein
MVTQILKMTGMLVVSRGSTHTHIRASAHTQTHTHIHETDELGLTIRHVVSTISRQAP